MSVIKKLCYKIIDIITILIKTSKGKQITSELEKFKE